MPDAGTKPRRTAHDDAARLGGPAEEAGGEADVRSAGAEREDEKDHEWPPEGSEAFVYAAMMRSVARRLARR
ncbi:MAG: hypothetical protein M3Q49_02590 [Actinomycetota bacterium]|nr:hypothetical protein [Actinomycetota bacterium]MDP9484676.1 hypothetical protein [Actinomycetota bacterium]